MKTKSYFADHVLSGFANTVGMELPFNRKPIQTSNAILRSYNAQNDNQMIHLVHPDLKDICFVTRKMKRSSQ